ncbi:MAG: DUF2807 domain-containing protein [Candidatus Andeanibacterium colombiense]|uniref:DUF2807 domain-containing protein n=1 Tax=Candidatus Andeanibacterium colombiense TaxID=3121345 RepID=A0AAJ6BNM0_9SPHN|nr:MAG: DUF2807 domain-containing protein [Sphingomonadaceae bacterium]
MPAPRNAFRKREIAFALGMGALAAGGAAATLAVLHDDERTEHHAPMTRDYRLAPFEQISVSGPQDLEITYGGTTSVQAEGSAEALNQLEVTVKDGKLSIKPKAGFFGGNFALFDDVTVHISLPDLKQIELAGSGDVQIDRIEGKSFAASISGSGSMAIEMLKVEYANLNITGSGDLTAAGTAGETQIDVAGSGEVDAGELHSTTATIAVGRSGNVSLFVDREAEVSVTGSGDVNISGGGHCSVTQTGSGDVSCAGYGADRDD